jgi:hypothetical protein
LGERFQMRDVSDVSDDGDFVPARAQSRGSIEQPRGFSRAEISADNDERRLHVVNYIYDKPHQVDGGTNG